MIIRDVQLETVCGFTSTLPENSFYEVAFAGKSNVGKSSLINTLINRKSLARTSSSPGKTQTINFYRVKASPLSAAQKAEGAVPAKKIRSSASGDETAVNDLSEAQGRAEDVSGDRPADISGDISVYFVDLPGYGYAKASAQSKEQWGTMIERYLKKSAQLKAVFLLVDIRHVPGANDVQMYEWICANGFDPVIIATKLDKIKRSQTASQIRQIREKLRMKPGSVLIPFSAQTKQGRDEIWNCIARMGQ